MKRTMQPGLPRLVVVGGGFAGLRAVKALSSRQVAVTLIDRQNHHVFQPLLYQVATAGLSAVDIAQPIRAVLSNRPNLEVVMAEVTAVDLATKTVTHSRGRLHYDYLLLAAGSETSYFNHPEWAELAPGLKTLDDALGIRRRILIAFEEAETEPDAQRRFELMTLVVVGGGPTGVELAGSLADLTRRVLRKDFDRIDPTEARVVLVSSGPRVLETFPDTLSAKAQRQLEAMGVEVRTGVRASLVGPGELRLGDNTLRAGVVIWAAGVSASPLGKLLGVPLDRQGRAPVQPDLSLPGHPEVFVAGDLAGLTDVRGVRVPGVAQAAIQMGEHVAKIIGAEVRPRKVEDAAPARPPFLYVDKGNLATIGRSAAVAQIGRLHLSGWLAWVTWLSVHLVFLIGFRNRMAVMLDWFYSYVTFRRGARVITGHSGRGPAGSA